MRWRCEQRPQPSRGIFRVSRGYLDLPISFDHQPLAPERRILLGWMQPSSRVCRPKGRNLNITGKKHDLEPSADRSNKLHHHDKHPQMLLKNSSDELPLQSSDPNDPLSCIAVRRKRPASNINAHGALQMKMFTTKFKHDCSDPTERTNDSDFLHSACKKNIEESGCSHLHFQNPASPYTLDYE
jgi:hypothetical protein